MMTRSTHLNSNTLSPPIMLPKKNPSGLSPCLICFNTPAIRPGPDEDRISICLVSFTLVVMRLTWDIVHPV